MFPSLDGCVVSNALLYFDLVLSCLLRACAFSLRPNHLSPFMCFAGRLACTVLCLSVVFGSSVPVNVDSRSAAKACRENRRGLIQALPCILGVC